MEPANFSFRSTQNVLIIILLIFSSQRTFSQFSCDSIQLGSIQYSATNAEVIEVQAMTISNDCVSYPSFVLYDQNGDTLAMETVNFFCIGIGNFSSHPMNVLSNATIPFGPFDGTLELFSGFGGPLVCSWDLTLDLCPPDSCVEAQIYLTNTDVLEAGSVYWSVYDDDNTVSLSGIITMDLVDHTHFDTICLPPGNYSLFVSPFSDIWVDEDYILGITPNYYYSIGTNTAQQNDSTPQDLLFNWYEACAEGTNAVEEIQEVSISVKQTNGSLMVSSVDLMPLGQLELLDSRGRLIQSIKTTSSNVEIDVNTLATGLYILQNTTPARRNSAQKLFIR